MDVSLFKKYLNRTYIIYIGIPKYAVACKNYE